MNTAQLKPRRRLPHVCMRCGCEEVSVRHHQEMVDFKGLTVEARGLAETVCASCGHTWTTDGQEQDNLRLLQEAYAARRDAVRARDGLLTGEQIDYVLGELSVTRAAASKLFGGGPNAFAKYVRGEVLQSLPMDRLLRLALAFGAPALRVLEQGQHAPLKLNCGGYFVAPPLSNTEVSQLQTEATAAPLLTEHHTKTTGTTLTFHMV
jgi:putative zinc finger/helix-turn-helix YgiT family protein